jgi:formyl-CoA transferase
MYIMTQHLAGASIGGDPPPVGPLPAHPLNPLNRLYKTRDGRWLNLCFLQDRWFPDLARHIGREDLITDPRFATEDAKYENAAALIEQLDGVFATRTLAEWCDCFKDLEGVWAPLFNAWEVNADPQARANGFVTEVTDDDGFTYLASAPPGQFDEQPVGPLRASPKYAQHTDDVLAQIGLTPDQIDALRAAKVIV